MKSFLIALVLMFGLSVFAQEILQGQCTKDYVASNQGCCSYHSGVCGCGGYRLLCCDGTLSPSCPCFKEDEKLDLRINCNQL